MFESVFGVNRTRSGKRWLFFPVSLFFHFLVIAAVIAVPLINAEGHLPEMKVAQVFLTAPPAPQPPGPPRGRGEGGKGSKRVENKKEAPKPVKPVTREFIVPPEVPQEIPEEEFVVPGAGGGYDDSFVPGGLDDGELNPIFIKKVDPDTQSISISRVELPRLIKRVAPHYPEVARKAKVQGTVELRAVTDIYGKVMKVWVIKGNMLLRRAALQAVKQWIYEPYVINGLPKPVTFTVAVNFVLHR
jgi:protein TonB